MFGVSISRVGRLGLSIVASLAVAWGWIIQFGISLESEALNLNPSLHSPFATASYGSQRKIQTVGSVLHSYLAWVEEGSLVDVSSSCECRSKSSKAINVSL